MWTTETNGRRYIFAKSSVSGLRVLLPCEGLAVAETHDCNQTVLFYPTAGAEEFHGGWTVDSGYIETVQAVTGVSKPDRAPKDPR